MGQPDSHAIQMRAPITELLDLLAHAAEARNDVGLRMTVDALRRVHNLFPEHDDLALRGTPEHQARVAIHNAIVAAVDAHFEDLVRSDATG